MQQRQRAGGAAGWAVAALAATAMLAACTGGDGATPDPTAAASTSMTAETPRATPTPSPSPTVVFDEDAVLGEGTVVLDGEEVVVTGDCDISRDFGTQAVDDVTAPDVDILLAVGNLDEPAGTEDAARRVSLEMLGVDGSGDRTVVVTRVSGDVVERYRGTVDALALVDRTQLEFVDVATLHVEATASTDDGASVDVAADVTCVITRP